METVLKDRDAMVALYAPYCEGCERPELLDLALEKLLTRRLNGSRQLKPDGSHPFELTWQPGESPQEPSQCQLSFPEIQAVTYSFSIPTSQAYREGRQFRGRQKPVSPPIYRIVFGAGCSWATCRRSDPPRFAPPQPRPGQPPCLQPGFPHPQQP